MILARPFLSTILEKYTLEIVGSILTRTFYTISEKETVEVIGSILSRLCGIVKDVTRYVLKKPRRVIFSLMSHLILTMARPLYFRLVYLLYAVLSVIMSYIY